MNLFGKRYELFEVTRGVNGSVGVFSLTSNSSDILHEGKRYLKSTVSRDSIKIHTALEKQSLKVSLDLESEEGQLFIGSSVEDLFFLKLYDFDGIEATLSWRGRLVSVKSTSKKVELTFEKATTLMKKDGLFRKTSKLCPYAVYDQDCGVSKAAHSFEVKIESVVGKVVTFSTPLYEDFEESLFSGGYFTTGSAQFYLVESSTGMTATLLTGFRDFSKFVGQTMLVSKGCDQSPRTCKSRFNNLDRCGAFGLIPDSNPYETGVM